MFELSMTIRQTINSSKTFDATSLISGKEFFGTLARHLCSSFTVDFMHVALFSKDDSQTMMTIYCGGHVELESPHLYFTSETFHKSLTEEGKFCCHQNAAESYPEDFLLTTMKVDSCYAVPLKDRLGGICGALSIMSDRPLQKSPDIDKALNCFAPRVALEALRKQMESELKNKLWVSQAALDSIPTPIFFKDKEGAFSGWNRAFSTFCGLSTQSDDSCAELEGYLGIYAEEDRQLISEGGHVVIETTLTGADGKDCDVLLHKAGIVKSNGQTLGGMVGTMIDVTELRCAEKKAIYLEHYDRLTGLPNQMLFYRLLNGEISHARRHNMHLAVFAIDLDHFKRINNVYGHDLGDELLKEVASRISDTVREEDALARLGGDSFTLLLRNIRFNEDAAIVARKIQENLAPPFFLGGGEVYVSTSIGIALFPLDGDDVSTLIKNSDIALHRAKENGRDTHLFFTSEMNERASEQMQLQNNLRKALERSEFVLHYQPQYDARTGLMLGVEALLRWQHPEHGMIYPDKFIHIAEHVGLIVPIGDWVLRTACQHSRDWNEKSDTLIRVSVNLSARQFQEDDLFARISRIIDETGVNPNCLGLEITESVVMNDVDYAVDVLTRLKALGVHLSVDDFGTGYSSLSYLKRFPIDLLKIDRSFITDIPEELDDIAIVSPLISMALNLKLKVLAKGV
jgi:diguanylate cyclase (GGDEF)-like protein